VIIHSLRARVKSETGPPDDRSAPNCFARASTERPHSYEQHMHATSSSIAATKHLYRSSKLGYGNDGLGRLFPMYLSYSRHVLEIRNVLRCERPGPQLHLWLIILPDVPRSTAERWQSVLTLNTINAKEK